MLATLASPLDPCRPKLGEWRKGSSRVMSLVRVWVCSSQRQAGPAHRFSVAPPGPWSSWVKASLTQGGSYTPSGTLPPLLLLTSNLTKTFLLFPTSPTPTPSQGLPLYHMLGWGGRPWDNSLGLMAHTHTHPKARHSLTFPGVGPWLWDDPPGALGPGWELGPAGTLGSLAWKTSHKLRREEWLLHSPLWPRRRCWA